jgi:hypothetical protein
MRTMSTGECGSGCCAHPAREGACMADGDEGVAAGGQGMTGQRLPDGCRG